MHVLTTGSLLDQFIRITLKKYNEKDFGKMAYDQSYAEKIYDEGKEILIESNLFEEVKKSDIEVIAVECNSPPALIINGAGLVPSGHPANIIDRATIEQFPAIRFFTINANQFDAKGDMQWGNGAPYKDMRGGLAYYLPRGWQRFGIKVVDKYGQNNDWLLKWDESGWGVGYHGVGRNSAAKIPAILNAKLLPGPRQLHANSDDTRKVGRKVGRGIYFATHVEVADTYSERVVFDGKTYKILLQCRLDPVEIRIPSRPSLINKPGDDWQNDYMVVPNGTYARPYGIIIQE